MVLSRSKSWVEGLKEKTRASLFITLYLAGVFFFGHATQLVAF